MTQRPSAVTPRARKGGSQSRRFVAAQRVSSLRLDSWSLRNTFESHASNVLRKLQLSNRNELTRWAATNRLL